MFFLCEFCWLYQPAGLDVFPFFPCIFCVSAEFFFDRWYFQVFAYILVSDIPEGVDYCSQYLRCSDFSLFTCLIATVPHSVISYVQIGFITVLQSFDLFSMLSLEFRLVSQYICLLFIHILSRINLVCSLHVNYLSKWNSRYLTCLVCVMCVLFNRIFAIQTVMKYCNEITHGGKLFSGFLRNNFVVSIS